MWAPTVPTCPRAGHDSAVVLSGGAGDRSPLFSSTWGSSGCTTRRSCSWPARWRPRDLLAHLLDGVLCRHAENDGPPHCRLSNDLLDQRGPDEWLDRVMDGDQVKAVRHGTQAISHRPLPLASSRKHTHAGGTAGYREPQAVPGVNRQAPPAGCGIVQCTGGEAWMCPRCLTHAPGSRLDRFSGSNPVQSSTVPSWARSEKRLVPRKTAKLPIDEVQTGESSSTEPADRSGWDALHRSFIQSATRIPPANASEPSAAGMSRLRFLTPVRREPPTGSSPRVRRPHRSDGPARRCPCTCPHSPARASGPSPHPERPRCRPRPPPS